MKSLTIMYKLWFAAIAVSLLISVVRSETENGFKYIGGSITWEAFKDESTSVVIRMRVSWLYDENKIDITKLCRGDTGMMTIPSGLMTIDSISLKNETSFRCQVSHRHRYVSVTDNFIRYYGNNLSYTESIRISGPLSEKETWELGTEIQFRRLTAAGTLASPPQVGITPLIVMDSMSNPPRTHYIGASAPDSDDFTACYWPATSSSLPDGKKYFVLDELTCAITTRAGVPENDYLITVAVIGSTVKPVKNVQPADNNLNGETTLQFTVRIGDLNTTGDSFNLEGIDDRGDRYELSHHIFYHELTEPYYCFNLNAEPTLTSGELLGFMLKDIKITKTKQMRLDGMFLSSGPANCWLTLKAKNSTEITEDWFWKPTIADLGTNVVCLDLQGSNIETQQECFYVVTYIDGPTAKFPPCGNNPTCTEFQNCMPQEVQEKTPPPPVTIPPLVTKSKPTTTAKTTTQRPTTTTSSTTATTTSTVVTTTTALADAVVDVEESDEASPAEDAGKSEEMRDPVSAVATETGPPAWSYAVPLSLLGVLGAVALSVGIMYMKKKSLQNNVEKMDAFEEGDFIHQSKPKGSVQLRKFSNISAILPNAVPLPKPAGGLGAALQNLHAKKLSF